MINLNNVTLVSVACTKIYETIDALNYSMQSIKFEDCILFTHQEVSLNSKIRLEKINQLKSIKDWSNFVIFDLHKYISSEFILLVHWDGFVINPKKWNKEFLYYDYIGSPWPKFKKAFPKIANNFPDNKYRVGNSVSIRSKKFLEAPSKINLNWEADGDISNFHEDGYICVQKRGELENYGIRYAPFELACHFGREYTFFENQNIEPFIFHKWYGQNTKYTRLSNKLSFKERFKRLINFGYF